MAIPGIARTVLLVSCLLGSIQHAWAQQATFDYGIADVRMFDVDAADNRKIVDGLEAYLYDIGPQPHFVFEVDVRQHAGKSTNAIKSNLVVELYLLLARTGNAVYKSLSNPQADLGNDTTWVYHGPVALTFSRKQAGKHTTFTSAPHQMLFLDPAAPITFARPADFSILGYAYRFLLVPAHLAQQDANPADNAFQLTFMKP
ncbi:MAG: hypothetical protein AAF564_06935 [Bacteroidota bacterium]